MVVMANFTICACAFYHNKNKSAESCSVPWHVNQSEAATWFHWSSTKALETS
jgi:hypothetical protein